MVILAFVYTTGVCNFSENSLTLCKSGNFNILDQVQKLRGIKWDNVEWLCFGRNVEGYGFDLFNSHSRFWSWTKRN